MDKLFWVLSSSALTLFVIALRALLGRRMNAGLRYGLWALVLLRLLIPGTLFRSAASLENLTLRAAPSAAVLQAPQPPAAAAGADAPQSGTAAESVSGQAPQTASGGPTLQSGSLRTARGAFDSSALLYVWYAGASLTALLFAASNLRFWLRLRRRRVPLAADGRQKVYAVAGLASSCLFGNAIYVSAETAGDAVQLRHILAHELAHRRHGDGLWSCLRGAALCLHWFNPLVWWAAVLSRRDAELFADAGALRGLGAAEREAYGETLIRLTAACGGHAPLLCTATAMAGGKRALRERIRQIARRPSLPRAALVALAFVGILAAGCAFTGGKAAEVHEFAPQELSICIPYSSNSRDYRGSSVWDGTDVARYYAAYCELQALAQPLPEDFTAEKPLIYTIAFRDNELEETRTFWLGENDLFYRYDTEGYYQLPDSNAYYVLFDTLFDALDGTGIAASASDLSGTEPAPAEAELDTTFRSDEQRWQWQVSMVNETIALDTAYDYATLLQLYAARQAGKYLTVSEAENPYRCTAAEVSSAGDLLCMESLTAAPKRLAFNVRIALTPADAARFQSAFQTTSYDLEDGVTYLQQQVILQSEDGRTWFPAGSGSGINAWGYRNLLPSEAETAACMENALQAAAGGDAAARAAGDALLLCAEQIPWAALEAQTHNAVYAALRAAATGEDQLSRDLYLLYAAAQTDGASAELFFDALLPLQFEADSAAFLDALDELPEAVYAQLIPSLPFIR